MQYRTVEALQRKVKLLWSATPPTGSSTVPRTVARAIWINDTTVKQIGMKTGSRSGPSEKRDHITDLMDEMRDSPCRSEPDAVLPDNDASQNPVHNKIDLAPRTDIWQETKKKEVGY